MKLIVLPAAETPAWWSRAKAELSAADPVMAKLIARCPDAQIVPKGDAFESLARAIVGQQISVQAARTIWARVATKAGDISPNRFTRMRLSSLQACGLSEKKAHYVRELARCFLDGKLEPQRWPDMDDEAVIADLTQVHGIGRWTAEMFLIFTLLRPDVLPLDDVGLQNGVKLAYDSRQLQVIERESDLRQRSKLLRAQCEKLGEQWRPWRSAATFFLWRSLDVVALTPDV